MIGSHPLDDLGPPGPWQLGGTHTKQKSDGGQLMAVPSSPRKSTIGGAVSDALSAPSACQASRWLWKLKVSRSGRKGGDAVDTVYRLRFDWVSTSTDFLALLLLLAWLLYLWRNEWISYRAWAEHAAVLV